MKTLRIREEVYEKLQVLKRPDESISDLLSRLLDRENQFERGFGEFSDVNFEQELDELDERLDDESSRSG
ncbi:MAG: antitoxin VapB family protein [Halodesulfurarchaeum sp.]|nr:antitoxin VapB family protein [Halodesulfurarchaeum sp.]